MLCKVKEIIVATENGFRQKVTVKWILKNREH